MSRSKQGLEPVSATFHGRDLFAPVAAHLANGAELSDLGEPLDPGAIVALELTRATVTVGRVEAHAVHVDSFGNVSLDAGEEGLEDAGFELGQSLMLNAGGAERAAIQAATFADVPEGQLIAYVDAAGSLAIAVNQGSAAEELGLGEGDEVVLRGQ